MNTDRPSASFEKPDVVLLYNLPAPVHYALSLINGRQMQFSVEFLFTWLDF